MSRIKIIKKLFGRIIINARNPITEASIKENKIQINKTYSGYFQEWMYADYLILKNHIFSPVPKNNQFRENIIFKEYNSLNPILVHIRLGDYLEFSKIYQILPEKYFLSAIDNLIQRNGSRPIWLVVEDVEQTLKFYPALSKLASKFIDKNLELEDHEVFYLMAKSNFLVASNSTFSLWASWFTLNAGGDVIVPSVFNVSGIPSKLIDRRWNSIDIFDFSFIPKRDLGMIRNENVVRFNELFL